MFRPKQKKVKLKEVILLKSSVPHDVAEQIARKAERLVIILDDFNDFSTLNKDEVIERLKDN